MYVCRSCLSSILEPGEELVTSSADFVYCSMCQTYLRDDDDYEYVDLGELIDQGYVELIECDECDCLERYGRILHNNGGHYHYCRYVVKRPIDLRRWIT